MSFLTDPYRTPTAKLTSKPYPAIVDSEGMTGSVALMSARMNLIRADGSAVAASLTSGELRQLLKTYRIPAEAQTVVVSLQSGELRQLLKTYDIPYESQTVAVSIQSGELKVLLIEYRRWNARLEQMTVGASLISGVLA